MLRGSSSAQWRSTAQRKYSCVGTSGRSISPPLCPFPDIHGRFREQLNSLKAPTGHKVLIAAPAEEYLSLRSWYFFVSFSCFVPRTTRPQTATCWLRVFSFPTASPLCARLQPDEGVLGAGCQLPGAALSLLQENLKWTSVSFLFPSLSSCRSQAESHFTSRPSPLSPSPPFCTFTVSRSVKCCGPNGRRKWRYSRGTLHAKCSEIFSEAASYFADSANLHLLRKIVASFSVATNGLPPSPLEPIPLQRQAVS